MCAVNFQLASTSLCIVYVFLLFVGFKGPVGAGRGFVF